MYTDRLFKKMLVKKVHRVLDRKEKLHFSTNKIIYLLNDKSINFDSLVTTVKIFGRIRLHSQFYSYTNTNKNQMSRHKNTKR